MENNLKLTYWPDSILKTSCEELKDYSFVNSVMNQMIQTMKENNGIGLAANQIGLPYRFFVMYDGDKDNILEFINPKIISFSEKKTKDYEGCLSFPGVYEKIKRPESIVVEALNSKGKYFTRSYSGIYGKCVQHEIDHLNGKTFLDLMSPTKQKKVLRKFNV